MLIIIMLIKLILFVSILAHDLVGVMFPSTGILRIPKLYFGKEQRIGTESRKGSRRRQNGEATVPDVAGAGCKGKGEAW